MKTPIAEMRVFCLRYKYFHFGRVEIPLAPFVKGGII
ncbi:MAG: hypothetical protein UU95_C0029G0017 [Parcubacteria group bacterium GW2011_GWC2_42_12]|nr:MAG: hypothetical protein UU95_C0029G0017 [Parcubacteria group bacterium GW2011_GWC2_42_12]